MTFIPIILSTQNHVHRTTQTQTENRSAKAEDILITEENNN